MAIIPSVGDRQLLERKVAALAEEHQGREFVRAVERLAGTLDPRRRALLEQVLLERSADGYRDAIAARVEAKGWIRRQLDMADERRPPRG